MVPVLMYRAYPGPLITVIIVVIVSSQWLPIVNLWPLAIPTPLGHHGLWPAASGHHNSHQDLLKLSSIHPEPLPSGIFIPAEQVHMYDMDSSPLVAGHHHHHHQHTNPNTASQYPDDPYYDYEDEDHLLAAKLQRLRARKRLQQELRKSLLDNQGVYLNPSRNGKLYKHIRLTKTSNPNPITTTTTTPNPSKYTNNNGKKYRSEDGTTTTNARSSKVDNSETQFDDDLDDGTEDNSRDGSSSSGNLNGSGSSSSGHKMDTSTEYGDTKDGKGDGKEETYIENYQRTTEAPR